MNELRLPKSRLEVLKFKLDALLDITLQINANQPTDVLLSKYESILRNYLGIGKVLLFIFREKWEVLLNAGFSDLLRNKIDVEQDLLRYQDIITDVPKGKLKGVDIIIPVFNNNAPLAYVLIGDIDEEGEGMSPVIKHQNYIQTISSIIVVAIENQRLFNESLKQEAMRKELEVAARMQMALIPDNNKLPVNEQLRIQGFYNPHYEVGGDYYDFLRLDEQTIGFCIADVSGKGVSAAMLMSNFQASLRALFTSTIDLGSLVIKLNEIINHNAAGEKFITFFVARVNLSSRHLEYINAAHNPPVLIDLENNEISKLAASCVGIGMLDEIPSIKRASILLPSGVKIICYTDGLSELKDDDGNDIGTSYIEKHFTNKNDVRDNIKALIEDLDISGNNPALFDDVSILAVEIL
jgi:phosphoserine phosphatase RsbU/P